MQALQARMNVIRALVIRDMMVRYGRANVGFVWTIMEPMILTGGVLVLWSLLKEPIFHGMPVIAFVLTGYMPLTLWRHVTGPQIRVLRANAGLLYHRPLHHMDIVLARLALEFLSTTAALTVVYLIVLGLGLTEPVQDWTLLLGGWLLTGWVHAGLGLIYAAGTERFDVLDKFIQPFQYFLLPLSGVFFLIEWLPAEMQRIVVWNPTINCVEMFRAGYFGESVVTHYDAAYAFVWGCVLWLIGCAAVLNVRDHVRV